MKLSKQNMKRVLSHFKFGENVFTLEKMKRYLSDKAYKSLSLTVNEGEPLDPSIADEVADAMKTWAIEKGATHFTHWFQPLTDGTAEKHEAFLSIENERVISKFSGKELIKGEPDASSFPSGGLRTTFEARGYTAWDPISPAFLRVTRSGAVLCIPTVFFAYHGESLDQKTPLLRSIDAFSKQLARLASLLGINKKSKTVINLGIEQEYFLIDRKFYEQRPDLVQTGRTLFGRPPAKHQQLEDHYFGAIKSRIINFMDELDRELWKLGVPARTRHNEVSPAQFEIAPLYEEIHIAIDHNMLIMNMLREIADKHGFTCLLHEKPFLGVNGSGKHNNWSIIGPDGKNWLIPGENLYENAKFLTIICALISAVDTHADLLRASVASAGNDLRLGANEAPPVIISIFLGEQLTEIIEQIEKVGVNHNKKADFLRIGLPSIPVLPKDATDRNRTSPLAFTGNKFEFRLIGASQNCAWSNVVLNTAMAGALENICNKLEIFLKDGKNLFEALQIVLRDIIRKHKRIIFNGDNYSTEWHREASKRGLHKYATAPEALKNIIKKESIELFSRYNVLSERELYSRYEIAMQNYNRIIYIEGRCALDILRSMIIPAVISYQKDFATMLNKTYSLKGSQNKNAQNYFAKILRLSDILFIGCERLEKAIQNGNSEDIIYEMVHLREIVDELEGYSPRKLWPMPTYLEMLFLL